MTTLLDDIEAEYHNHLLEAGNLKKSRHAWTDDLSWLNAGYSGRILAVRCTRCESVTESLQGIFTKETRGRTTLQTRETSINLSALGAAGIDEVLKNKISFQRSEVTVPLCAACVFIPSL